MSTIKKALTGISVSALAMAAATSAHAGAFALKERSAKAQGLSFAGASAGSGGLQSMGFNPAAIGMVAPGGGNGEISGGLSLIAPMSDGVVSDGSTVDADTLGFVANQYIGYRLDDEFLIGLAIYTPFGLSTNNKENAVVSADGATSKLATLVFAPTIGYAPIPELTLAASFNLTYVDARLTTVSGAASNAIDGSTWDYSFGVGALWDVTPSTRIGVAYQHGYDLEIDGEFTFIGGTVGVEADAQLPSTVSLGVVQELTDDFRVMGEVQWQNWSVFDKIDINVPAINLSQQDVQNYDDAFFVAVGGEYDVLNDLTVRIGAAWDQTPTNDDILAGTATNRTVRVPDEDRIWLSIGGSYDMDDHMTVDVGYSYLFTLDDPTVGLRTSANTVTYDGGAHIFSIGGSLKF